MTSTTLINHRARSLSLAAGQRSVPIAHASRLRLLPSGDGWSLVGEDGRLVFSALGLGGRQRCLEYAQAHGVVALTR